MLRMNQYEAKIIGGSGARQPRGVAGWAAALALLLLVGAAPWRSGKNYEQPGVVPARDYLPESLLQGESWTVAAEAVNDGLENTYTVESRFGSWEARGEEEVAVRITEIEALVKLEEVSKTKVFLDAVEASVTSPIRLIKSVSEKPKETLEGLPKGVHRWFKRTSFKVRETYHDVSEEVEEEREKRRARKEAEAQAYADAVAAGRTDVEDPNAAEDDGQEDDDSADEPSRRDELEEEAKEEAKDEALDYLRISSAERRWYRELRVDPSTDNELVRDGVQSVARVEGLTHFAMKFVPIPGLPFASEMRQSMDLVWSTHSGDLRVKNRKRLLDAGLSKSTAREFEDSKLTLTEQTLFLDSLERLDGVEDRAQLLALAIELENRREARSLTTTVALLAACTRARRRSRRSSPTRSCRSRRPATAGWW